MSLVASYTSKIGKLPFAGRHAIGPISKECIKERYAGPKILKTLGGLAFMGVMVVGHLYQARIGVTEGLHDASQFISIDGSVLRGAETAMDALFASANLAVVPAQTYIGYRMAHSLLKTLCKYPKVRPFEVGIDTDSVSSKQNDACPPYEVGIENEIATRRTFREWRRDNKKIMTFATDSAITLSGQALFTASTLH